MTGDSLGEECGERRDDRAEVIQLHTAMGGGWQPMAVVMDWQD